MRNKMQAFFLLMLIIVLASCSKYGNNAIRVIKSRPQSSPYLSKNIFEIKNDEFSKGEKENVKERMEAQLHDSSVVKVKSPIFFYEILKHPRQYDTAATNESSNNMAASMFHLGYYSASVKAEADTIHEKLLFIPLKNKKIGLTYTLDPGKKTLVDTLEYSLSDSILQALALKDKQNSYIKKGQLITKISVISEIGRLVDSFRNNGFYKFTTAELKMRGDTSIEALTHIAENPFEQLEALAAAEQRRDSPKIKLQLVINPPADSTKLFQYKVGEIYVLEDYQAGDNFLDTINIQQKRSILKFADFILRYHKKYIHSAFLGRSIRLKTGDLFSQNDFYASVTNLTKLGIWQSVNVKTEVNDSNKLLDFIFELIPVKKYGFQSSFELSYSTNTATGNPLGAKLFGVSLGTSLVTRNMGRKAISMTQDLRAGIELNFNTNSNFNTNKINSNELTYTNSLKFPSRTNKMPNIHSLESLGIPIFNERLTAKIDESFISTKLSSIQRLNLFTLSSFAVNYGTNYNLISKNEKNKIRTLSISPINAELNYLTKTDSFNKVIATYPFLRYSYTTSYILGTSATYTNIKNKINPISGIKIENSFKLNLEESGTFIWRWLPVFKNSNWSKYIKMQAEYKHTINYKNTDFVSRLFVGIGAPVRKDSSLPFFKQFYGGGSNSMRAWPQRGIGRGSQKLSAYQSENVFNDRTGDLQLECNLEWRHTLTRIIPNILTLKGAVFADIGNVWNWNAGPAGSSDGSQFKFKNVYKELGVGVGYGFRLDFNYVVIRIDMGLRVKRPEISDVNDGWLLPNISIGDLYGKLFKAKERFRMWRYENFNLTFGISYPF